MFTNSKFLASCRPMPIDKGEAMEDRPYFYLMTHDSRGHYFSNYAEELVKRQPNLAPIKDAYEERKREMAAL